MCKNSMLMDKAEQELEGSNDPNEDSFLLDGLISERESPKV